MFPEFLPFRNSPDPISVRSGKPEFSVVQLDGSHEFSQTGNIYIFQAAVQAVYLTLQICMAIIGMIASGEKNQQGEAKYESYGSKHDDFI
jgi:hypothetical protein